MEECTNVKGVGVEGLGMSGDTGELHLVHKAFSLLSCSLEDLAAWSSPPSPHPPPPAASAATIATQIPVLRSQLHRSHNLGCPFLLPHHTAPPRRPAIAAHAPTPHPPQKGNSFFHFTRAPRHTSMGHARTDWWAHAFFPPLLSLFLISFNFFPFSSP